MVQNAKLELPIDSADPLIPYQFHFEHSGWGQQWESNFDYERTPSESWEKEAVPSYWYDDFNWNQAQHYQDWDWQEKTTSTWLDESLPNGSSDIREEEGVLNEVLLEENSISNNVGLQVEEDDMEERPEGDVAGESSEDDKNPMNPLCE